MNNNVIIKSILTIVLVLEATSFLYAQSQYDYYDDSAVAGGADRALNGIIIIVTLVFAAIVLLFVIAGALKVYYWLNPKSAPSNKRKEAEKEKQKEVSIKKESNPISAPIIPEVNYGIVDLLSHKKLTEKEIKDIINPSNEDKKNTKVDPTCKYGCSIYTIDNKKFLNLDVSYGLDDPQRPNRILTILEGTETICSNAIRSDYLETLVLPKTLLYIGDNSINCKSIKEIILPESLQYVGDSAFYGCEKLQEFVIPQSLIHIGTFALSNTGINNIVNNSTKFKVVGSCLYDEKLKRLIKYFGSDTKIIVPDSVEDITGAFIGCNHLEQVILSKNLTSIGERTFMGCSHLKEVVIQDGVIEIGWCAFSGCKSLDKIVIPEGVRFIRGLCFDNCQNLRYIVLPSSIEKIGDEEFKYFDIFERCISLSYIFIPQGTKNKFVSYFPEELLIEENPEIFLKKKAQESIALPITNLSTTITEQEIREGWSDEAGVRYSADGKKLLYSTRRLGNTIYRSGIREYKVKSGTVVICDNAFESGNIESIELPDTIEKIGDRVFSGCRNLRQILIPNKVSYFGESVFSECDSLQHITIPESTSAIKKAMFCGCSSLKEFVIPPTVKEIHDYAFKGCSSLRNLLLPNSVEYIGNEAFGSCARLNEIILPSSVRFINGNPFTATKLTGNHYAVTCKSSNYIIENGGIYSSDKKILIACLSNETQFDVIDGVTIIGKGAFSESSKLQSIKLPSSILEISDNAFWGCEFNRIKLPSLIRSIGDYAFGNCEHISKIELPNGLERLGKNAFWNCKRISELILPKMLTQIEEEAFGCCDALKNIIILNPDISIDKKAFAYLDSLERIEFYGYPSNADNELFCWTNNLKEIIVPYGTKKKFCTLFPSQANIIKTKKKAKTEEKTIIALSTEISDTDNIDSWKDDSSVIYSKDRKKLLTCEYKAIVEDPFEDEFGNKAVVLHNQIVDYNDFNAFMNRMENILFYEVNNGTEIICDRAFSRCENLAKIIIPESVTAIGIRAFEDCKIMEEFIFPSNVRTVKEYCFIACRNLKTIILPDILEVIEKCAFVGCENLREIVFPNTVKTIAESAFSGCPLEKLILPENLESIGAHAFEFTNIKEVCIPENVKKLGRNAFANCRELRTVEFKCNDVECDGMPFVNVINEKGDTDVMQIKVIYVPKGSKNIYSCIFNEYKNIIVEME